LNSRSLSAGFEIAGFDLSADARQELKAAGGVAAETVADALRGADAAITMLPNGKIVQDAIFGEDVWKALNPNALVIDADLRGSPRLPAHRDIERPDFLFVRSAIYRPPVA
jgi:3-hydroxyisobutyrate dehydrogenase-like beta-hydroxyacid dehydrogenase